MHSQSIMRTHMPYLLLQTEDGSWLALNRAYKPLGQISDEWVDYNNHHDRVRIKPKDIERLRSLTPHLSRMGWMDRGDPRVYLHAGDPASDGKAWAAYVKVLRALSNITHEFDETRDGDRPKAIETEACRQARIEREHGQDR